MGNHTRNQSTYGTRTQLIRSKQIKSITHMHNNRISLFSFIVLISVVFHSHEIVVVVVVVNMMTNLSSSFTGFIGQRSADVGGQQMRRNRSQGTDGQGRRRTGQTVVIAFHGNVSQNKLQRQRTFPSKLLTISLKSFKLIYIMGCTIVDNSGSK